MIRLVRRFLLWLEGIRMNWDRLDRVTRCECEAHTRKEKTA